MVLIAIWIGTLAVTAVWAVLAAHRIGFVGPVAVVLTVLLLAAVSLARSYLAHRLAVLERHDAGDRDVAAPPDDLLHRGDVARVAVVEHAGLPGALLVEDREGLPGALAVVDDDRQVARACRPQLDAEDVACGISL